MPTAAEMVAALGPGLLEVVSGDGGAEVRDIALLTVSEGLAARVDDADLVACVAAPGDTDALPELLTTWADRAAGVALERSLATDPAVLAAARRVGLTVLAVPTGTAWAQLVWLLVDLLDRSPVAGAPDRSPATGFGGLFTLADVLEGVLGGPVTIEDAASRVLAHSARQEQADPARLSSIVGRRVPAELAEHFRATGVLRALHRSDDPVLVPSWGPGISPRLVIPVRAGSELLGSIWAVVDRPVPPEQVVELRRVVSLLALQLLRLRAQEDLVARLETERLHAALTGAAPAGWSPPGTPPWRVVCLWQPPESAGSAEATPDRAPAELGMVASSTEQWRSALRWSGWRTPLLARVDDLVVAVVDSASAHHPGSWRWLEGNLGNGLAAASRQVTSLDGLPAARLEAAATLHLLRQGTIGRHLAAITVDDAWPALVVSRAVEAVRGEPLPEPVQRLLDHDHRHGTEYARTLLADLTHPGDPRAAAASLHVHPNTFRYRMRKAAEVAPLDRGDPQVRLAAQLLLSAAASGRQVSASTTARYGAGTGGQPTR